MSKEYIKIECNLGRGEFILYPDWFTDCRLTDFYKILDIIQYNYSVSDVDIFMKTIYMILDDRYKTYLPISGNKKRLANISKKIIYIERIYCHDRQRM